MPLKTSRFLVVVSLEANVVDFDCPFLGTLSDLDDPSTCKVSEPLGDCRLRHAEELGHFSLRRLVPVLLDEPDEVVQYLQLLLGWMGVCLSSHFLIPLWMVTVPILL